MLRILCLLILSFFLINCNGVSDEYSPSAERSEAGYAEADATASMKSQSMDMDGEMEEAAPPAPPSTPEQVANNRKIIYTADARMRVDSLEAAISKIKRILDNSDGFLSNQRMEDNSYTKTAILEMRLPVNGFASSIESMLKVGNFIDHQNLNSRDVSAEWVDLESRLNTKREVRDRYVEILRKRAVKVEDILEAEDKIRQITEEIEAKEGRLRYLRDQVSMSTFTLNLYETQEVRNSPPSYRRTFGSQIADALSNGLYIVKGLLLGLLSIWPFFLLLPLIVWGYRRWKK